jgi:hypothetical protein
MQRLVVLLAVAAITACNQNTLTVPNTALVGSYALLSVNDSSLPAVTLQNGGETDEILSGRLSMDAKDVGPFAVPTYTLVLTQRITRGAAVTVQDLISEGTWSGTNASDLFFSDNSSKGLAPLTGFYANRSIAISTVDLRLTFKQN